MSEDKHNRRGQFVAGQSGNPAGRPKKRRSVDDAILKAIDAPVTITQDGKRQRVRKVDATAMQLANKGAAGDLRAVKIALDLAQKAQERAEGNAVNRPGMTASDREIATRVIDRLAQIVIARAPGISGASMNNSNGSDGSMANGTPNDGDVQ